MAHTTATPASNLQKSITNNNAPVNPKYCITEAVGRTYIIYTYLYILYVYIFLSVCVNSNKFKNTNLRLKYNNENFFSLHFYAGIYSLILSLFHISIETYNI